MRLIDADALKRDICKYCNDVYSDEPCEPSDCEHMRIIDNQPTIDAVEVVHGRWDDSGRYQFPNGRKAIRCNICGCALSESEYSLFNWNYCPVCGTKMDGERKYE